MQIGDFFRENMLLEVYDHASGVYYKSLLQEVNAANLAMGIPMKEGRKLVLQEKTSYLFRLLREDALYYFRSEVKGSRKSDRVFLYLLAWPVKIERQQRRRFYRFAYTLDVDYWILAEDIPLESSGRKRKPAGRGATGLKIEACSEKWGEGWDGETLSLYRQVKAQEPRQAVVTNLSGGGLMLVAKHSLPPGVLLVLRFFLQSNRKEKKEVLVKGRVTRALPFKVGKVRYYRYGVEFWEISERTRDEIIRFIFSMFQRRLR